MTVKRYRDIADMPAPSPNAPGVASTYDRIRELWRFSSRLVPPLFQPGVYRFRSVEESGAARDRATIDRMRTVRATRTR